MRKFLFILAAGTLLSVAACAQDDAPSLGDVARQTRQQKQQKQQKDKDAVSKSAPNQPQSGNAKGDGSAKPPQAAAKRVITNEELPEHTAAAAPKSPGSSAGQDAAPATGGTRDADAGQWKSQIQSQKEAVASLQQQITSVGDSIHYAGGNCVRNCEQWNERQQQKQQQVDAMKAQLEDQQKKLEEMQESARRQGFGSQVYDP